MDFQLITVEPAGGCNLSVFARTIPGTGDEEETRRVRIDVPDFEPYFYIHAEETEHARELKEEGYESERGTKIEKIIEDFESIGGEPLTKVVINQPQTPDIREEFSSPPDVPVETWESDVNYTMRFRIDVEIKDTFHIPDSGLVEIGEDRYRASWTAFSDIEEEPTVDPRTFYFDIEVGGESAMPEDENLSPIVCITAFDNHTEQLRTWVWRDDFEQEDQRDVWYHDDVDEMYEWEIRRFDSETKMLADFFEHYKDTGYDILAGWYSDKYDVPYVINRAEELGLNPSSWSETGDVNDGLPADSWGQANVGGAFMHDIERRYDNLVSPPSSALDYVAENEEDVMSWPQESSNIDEIWQNDLNTLLEYNANDVIATWKVDESAGVTEFYLQKQYITGCRVEEIENDSNVITYYLMHEADSDEIIPRAKVRTHKEFGGGRVILPDEQGILSPVAVLDLSKIYPSIMITLGLSYENAKGVDPIRFNEEFQLSDKINEDAFEELPVSLEENVTKTGEVKENDKVYYLAEWSFSDGDVISPLSLGKKGRKKIWDKLYDMDPRGNLSKSADWEFVDPDDQVLLPEVIGKPPEEVTGQLDDGVPLDQIEVGGQTIADRLGDSVLTDRLPDDHDVDHQKEGERLPNGVRIDINDNGLVTRSLKQMFELREGPEQKMDELDPSDPDYEKKHKRLSKKKRNAKDQINAVFGYSGYKKSPLFSPEIAMTITFVGRHILKMCERVSEELGHEIIYGDTDSVFVLLDNDRFDVEEDINKCVYEGHRVGEIVNDRLSDFAVNFCGIGRDEHRFELEFEKLYSKIFLGDKKKRYAGLKTVTE